MSSQTSLVAKSCRLQQWAVQINECQNRPKAMTVDEWCDQHDITKATYYYRLKCVRQAYLDSAETPVTEFVEMPIPNEIDNSRGQSCVDIALCSAPGNICILQIVKSQFLKKNRKF